MFVFKSWKKEVYVGCCLPSGGRRGFQPGALIFWGRPRVHVTRRLPIPRIYVAVDSCRREAKAFSRLQNKTRPDRALLLAASFLDPSPLLRPILPCRASQGTKRRKTDKGGVEAAAAAVSEQLPTAGFRAHAQAVTGLAGPAGAGAGGGGGQQATLYSASLDRAVKTWDAERQDCVHTLNAPKAVTCLGCSDSGR